MFQGLGWMVVTFMYAIWALRLMSADLPSMRPAASIAVGPTGYTAQAFLMLGTRAPSIVPTDFFGVTSVATGDVLRSLIPSPAYSFGCLRSGAFVSPQSQLSKAAGR